MTKLKHLYEDCAAYFDDLYAPDKKVYVFGDGDPEARIVLVGEAPGEQETLLGKPFVGRAGKNLDEFLRVTGLGRGELYITNVVKFRPVRPSSGQRVSNRPPTREEIGLFLPWLKRELALLEPSIIVTLGNVPLRAVSGRSLTIGQAHGTKLGSAWGGEMFALYHPASIVYNPKLKDTYLQDLATFAQTAREMGLMRP